MVRSNRHCQFHHWAASKAMMSRRHQLRRLRAELTKQEIRQGGAYSRSSHSGETEKSCPKVPRKTFPGAATDVRFYSAVRPSSQSSPEKVRRHFNQLTALAVDAIHVEDARLPTSLNSDLPGYMRNRHRQLRHVRSTSARHTEAPVDVKFRAARGTLAHREIHTAVRAKRQLARFRKFSATETATTISEQHARRMPTRFFRRSCHRVFLRDRRRIRRGRWR